MRQPLAIAYLCYNQNMELALDTSTEIVSVALSSKGEVRAELTWYSEQNQTTELLPNLNYLLKQTGMKFESLEGIVVAKGPGSFSGLKAGMSTAKGLAFALNIPLVGISTLEVGAFPYGPCGLPICSILRAGRSEIAAAVFQVQDDKWLKVIEEHVTTVSDLCDKITEKTLFCGEIVTEVALELKERLKSKSIVVKGGASLRRASYLAELGWQRLKEGNFDDPATLQPLYLRKPSITTKKKIPSHP